MANSVPIAFSPNVEFCAYSSPDGALKLWEANTGGLKQEYIPSSHLSATCSCLSWGPSKTEDSPKKRKKKRKSQVTEAVENLDLIALGTTSGSLLLYSLTKGDLHTQLNHGHIDRVNGTCWHPSGEILYSCSSDQHIVQWQLYTATVKHKWKADKSGVYAIALGPTEDQLLSAGRTIKLWDLVKYEVLQSFSGHVTEVIQLLPVPNYLGGAASENGGTPISSTYFLSAATNDRLIHAWQTSSKDKTSLASFALPDEPTNMCISPHLHEQTVLLGATTKSGQLVIFEHVLNGRVKKPLKPKVTMQIATDTIEMPIPIPLLGAYFSADIESTVVFAYGNFLKPTFEKALYRSLESNTCFVRKDPNRTALKVESSQSKIQTPGVSQDLTVLSPGHMVPSGPAMEGQPSKRKRRKSTSGEMTLDERLHAISIEKPASTSKVPPKTDTLVTLLTQSLQSNDRKILNNVLHNPNETVVYNTVKKLPIQYIVPLIKELSYKLHGHASSGQACVKWMKAVLMYHTSYLMSYPDLVETLGGVHQMMENRVAMFGRLSKLHGKLELMLTQVTSHNVGEEEEASASQALLVFQDDSSDEDIIGDLEESENEWDEEESSEMEVAEEDEDSEDSGGGEDKMEQEESESEDEGL